MDTPTPKSFSLPDRKSIEVFTVKLPNGQTVMRTAAELLPAPKAANK